MALPYSMAIKLSEWTEYRCEFSYQYVNMTAAVRCKERDTDRVVMVCTIDLFDLARMTEDEILQSLKEALKGLSDCPSSVTTNSFGLLKPVTLPILPSKE